MPDRGKVIKGLDICAHPPVGRYCRDCPYFKNEDCNIDLMSDAITLLKDLPKEQEAVEPDTDSEGLKRRSMNMIKVKKHTEGDSRVAKELPTFSAFNCANEDHVSDVKNLAGFFAKELENRVRHHDWTKLKEPYRSMFYRDLCGVLEGRMDFFDGKWSKLHYCELERHHLKQHCHDDVNLFDVIEMICDCVAAGMARSGDVYGVDIPDEVLTKAVANTVKLLKDEIEVVT